MITTRSGRVVKKPVLYEPPVEKMTDDYDTDEYDTDDETSDLSEEDDESGSESGRSQGSLDEFIDDEDGEEFM